MRTLELLAGSDAARRHHCIRRIHDFPRPVWLQRGRPIRPWEGLRQLVSQLDETLGSARVRRVLDRHPAAADLLLAGSPFAASKPPPPGLHLPARLDSHLTHNALVKRPFLAAWIDMLEDLLGSSGVTLVAPDLAQLDTATVWLLDKLAQWRPEAFPSAVFGFEPDEEIQRPDSRGLVWGPPQILLSSFTFNLARQPEAQRLEAPEQNGDAPATGPPQIDDDADRRLLRTFEADSGGTAPELRRSMIGLVRRAFAGHAFEASLRWGLAVLERWDDLEPADEAELHNVVALSAHNRQFRSAGNEGLPPFLEAHFRRAFELETRPARKSALGYRLAVTLGRRQSRLDEALEAAEDALEIARSPRLRPVVSSYLQAWALNIRAFLHLRRGRRSQAVDDTEQALKSLSRLVRRWPLQPPAIRETWHRDLVLSWSVLVSNRIALAEIARDREALEHWQELSASLLEDYPEFELYEVVSRLHSHRQFLHFDLALEQAERGLQVARRERDTLWEYQLLAQKADLSYRLGKIEGTLEACEAAAEFRRAYRNPAVLGSLDLLHAEALDQSGRREDARRLLEGILDEGTPSVARRLEAHALAARLAARHGNAREAEEAANAAIETAVEHGSRDFLLLAATAAGAASHDLGRLDEAREAYTRALEIAATGEPDDPPPPAGDVFEAHLGVGRIDAEDLDPLLEALRLLPHALAEPRACRLLAPLAAAVEALHHRRPDLLEAPDLAQPLEQLCLVGSQRADAAAAVRRLRERKADR